jgi:hypothetical protein
MLGIAGAVLATFQAMDAAGDGTGLRQVELP